MTGLRRGTVKLVAYNSKWVDLFDKESRLLSRHFGKTIFKIEHVGSTAIRGIPAKPIIDIDVAVKSLRVARMMNAKFTKLGYAKRPKPGRPWEVLYVKGLPEKRTHYVHVIPWQSIRGRDDVMFRNFLRLNKSRATQYADLKRKLAKKYSLNRDKYTRAKSAFIKKTLVLAKENTSQ